MICSILLLVASSGGVNQPASQDDPVAWLAALHVHERRSGRDAWSWQALQQARAALADPTQPISAWDSWGNHLYGFFLEWRPLLMLLISLACLVLISIAWRTQRHGLGVLGCMCWFALLWGGVSLTSGTTVPLAIVKEPGLSLRVGNGLSYPQVMMQGEPVDYLVGAELEWQSEAGNGWVQVKSAGGQRGWLPADSVLVIK